MSPALTWTHDRDASASSWNARLVSLADANVFQSHEWGEHKRASGWEPLRLVARDASDQTVGMAQLLVRRFATLVALAWIPGGPAGGRAVWSRLDGRQLAAACGARAVYCRTNAVSAEESVDQQELVAAGWRRPRKRLGSKLSMRLAIGSTMEENRKRLTRNWRHNLKRSERGSLEVTVWQRPEPEAIRTLYEEMSALKGLSSLRAPADLSSLLRSLGERLVMVRCTDSEGRLLAIRACGVLGTGAWDLLAATAAGGRRSYAAYAAFWGLIEQLQTRGVSEFDLSGIDPELNPGVYNFKKGTGSERFQYLGEWQMASPAAMGSLAELVLATRLR